MALPTRRTTASLRSGAVVERREHRPPRVTAEQLHVPPSPVRSPAQSLASSDAEITIDPIGLPR